MCEAPLLTYIYDGPRWYDAASVKFMMSHGLCKWQHIYLHFNATTHRPAGDLASKLKKIDCWFPSEKNTLPRGEVLLVPLLGRSLEIS